MPSLLDVDRSGRRRNWPEIITSSYIHVICTHRIYINLFSNSRAGCSYNKVTYSAHKSAEKLYWSSCTVHPHQLSPSWQNHTKPEQLRRNSHYTVVTELFVSKRTGVPRTNACFGSQGVFYFLPTQKSLFYSGHTQKSSGCVFAKRNNLLGKAIPFSWRQIPHSVPMLDVNRPCTPCVSLTPRTHFPHTEHLFLYIKRHWQAQFFYRHRNYIYIYTDLSTV
jgi:hypothetical protein